MKNKLILLAILMTTLLSPLAQANNPTQALGTCLVDALNGKERKNLAKWIFFAIGSHPEIKQFSKVSAQDIQDTDQYVGKLITKMLTKDCPNELKVANKANPMAMQQAFEIVGKVAMQELMSNQDTMRAISNYAQYADLDKINQVMSN